MNKFKDYWYESLDGLKLYARDYQHPTVTKTLLCIPGLTRNSADFSELADFLAVEYRVIVVDLRGRGKSEYDSNSGNYHPYTYRDDMLALLDSLQVESVVLIGTSLGGLVSMLLNEIQPNRISAIIINDIGPEISQVGLDRIKAYISNPASVTNWQQAIENTREVHAAEYPDLTDQEWCSFAHNIYRENSRGEPVLNYDPAIAVPVTQQESGAVPPHLWTSFNAIGVTPLLVFRGQFSDILTMECIELMQKEKPDMQFVEVERCGHAPLLTEPVCRNAIEQFLKEL